MNINKREKILLIILGVVGVVYVYYRFFLTPVLNKTKIALTNMESYKQKIQDIKVKTALIDTKKKELEEVKAKFDEAKVILPPMERAPEIIYSISRLYGGKIDITNINLGAPVEYISSQNSAAGSANNNTSQNSNAQSTNGTSGKIFAVPVSISISAGSYSEAMNFITRLENEKRFVEITDVSISTTRPQTNETPVENTDVTEEVVADTPVITNDESQISVAIVEEGQNSEELSKMDEEPQKTVPQKQYVPKRSTSSTPVKTQTQTKTTIQVIITARYYYVDSPDLGDTGYELGGSSYGNNSMFGN